MWRQAVDEAHEELVDPHKCFVHGLRKECCPSKNSKQRDQMRGNTVLCWLSNRGCGLQVEEGVVEHSRVFGNRGGNVSRQCWEWR